MAPEAISPKQRCIKYAVKFAAIGAVGFGAIAFAYVLVNLWQFRHAGHNPVDDLGPVILGIILGAALSGATIGAIVGVATALLGSRGPR